MHLVAFVIRIYHNAWSPEHQIIYIFYFDLDGCCSLVVLRLGVFLFLMLHTILR